MARKQKFDGGTANEIARVAVKEFFEKGFDGTSMRSIADAAGCEAGADLLLLQNERRFVFNGAR